MKYRLKLLLFLLVGVLSQTGCGGKAAYTDESFSEDSPFKLRVDSDVDAACESARRALLGQGYLIDLASSEEVKARKAARGEGKQNAFIEMNVVCAPERNGSTIFATGVFSTYDLKKNSSSASVGLSALGSISLPIGQSVDSLVKVSEETINDKDFYKRFFTVLETVLVGMDDGEDAAEPTAETAAETGVTESPMPKAQPRIWPELFPEQVKPEVTADSAVEQAAPAVVPEPSVEQVVPVVAPAAATEQVAPELVPEPFPAEIAPAAASATSLPGQAATMTYTEPVSDQEPLGIPPAPAADDEPTGIPPAPTADGEPFGIPPQVASVPTTSVTAVPELAPIQVTAVRKATLKPAALEIAEPAGEPQDPAAKIEELF